MQHLRGNNRDWKEPGSDSGLGFSTGWCAFFQAVLLLLTLDCTLLERDRYHSSNKLT